LTTGKLPASKAGEELRDKQATREQKTVDASDLAQAKRKKRRNTSGQDHNAGLPAFLGNA